MWKRTLHLGRFRKSKSKGYQKSKGKASFKIHYGPPAATYPAVKAPAPHPYPKPAPALASYFPPSHHPRNKPQHQYGAPQPQLRPPYSGSQPPIHRPPQPPTPCHVLIATPSFVLQSPGYPQPYPADIQCYYTVRRSAADICSIELEFRRFYLEPVPLCSNDWLRIGAFKYCGLQQQRTRELLPHLPSWWPYNHQMFGSSWRINLSNRGNCLHSFLCGTSMPTIETVASLPLKYVINHSSKYFHFSFQHLATAIE